ncbi:MAG: hypothetical protein RLZZ15_4004 [Verrucomicrobiota bacterium]|jgi:HSP20 family molecular chaperone IbpA
MNPLPSRLPLELAAVSAADSTGEPASDLTTEAFRVPRYDCREAAGALQVVVFVPDVRASGVEIEARGADLFVTARRSRTVRPNWSGARLEEVQPDYQLRLRVGRSFEFAAMTAEIAQGVLTVTLPKRAATVVALDPGLRRVA